MHGLAASLEQARLIAAEVDAHPPAARVALCAPATLINRMADILAGSSILVGGQDCRAEAQGAFTGDVSAEMLADAGARMVLLGHSERRHLHGETDDIVAEKVRGAIRAGLEPIVCVGETLEQRDAGEAGAVVRAQIRGSLPSELAGMAFTVAYEPVWAIGTGRVPSPADIEAVHASIREDLVAAFGEAGQGVPILYGGSVNPANAAGLLRIPQVGGALVGGASLLAEDFLAILRAA